MGIHLRTHTDLSGDVVDYSWFESRACYLASLDERPPSSTFEEGGAYPCGAECDLPDYCAECGVPIGNPLTGEGESYVREFVASVLSPNPLSFEAVYPYQNGHARARAEALKGEYGYLFTD